MAGFDFGVAFTVSLGGFEPQEGKEMTAPEVSSNSLRLFMVNWSEYAVLSKACHAFQIEDSLKISRFPPI